MVYDSWHSLDQGCDSDVWVRSIQVVIAAGGCCARGRGAVGRDGGVGCGQGAGMVYSGWSNGAPKVGRLQPVSGVWAVLLAVLLCRAGGVPFVRRDLRQAGSYPKPRDASVARGGQRAL